MKRESKKKENIVFALLAAAVLVAGCLMLLWGQRNSAEQVFEIGFLHYMVDEQLSNDEDYVLSAVDTEKYNDMLELAKAWDESVKSVKGECETKSVSEFYGEFALYNMPYSFYDNGSDITAVLLSGYEETDRDAMIYAPYWWKKGYNVLIPRLRGDSETVQFSTFGVYEQYDIYDLIKYLGLEDSRLILHGRGTGAAAALLLAANENTPCNVELIVADSVYSDLETLKREQLKKQFGLSENFVGRFLSGIVEKQLGIVMSEVDINLAAAKSDAYKLFVSGSNDTFLGYSHTEEAFYGTDNSEMMSINGAAHRMAYTVSYFGNGRYCAKLDEITEKIFK